MKAMSEYLMLKKCPRAEAKSGIVLPDGVSSEPVKSTGFEVVSCGPLVTSDFKPGDIVHPGYPEEAVQINGMVFVRERHIIAKE